MRMECQARIGGYVWMLGLGCQGVCVGASGYIWMDIKDCGLHKEMCMITRVNQ